MIEEVAISLDLGIVILNSYTEVLTVVRPCCDGQLIGQAREMDAVTGKVIQQ